MTNMRAGNNETKTVRLAGKRWELPVVLLSGMLDAYFYEPVAFRKPKRGEHYVSGALPAIYSAPNDLGAEYIVIKLTAKARQSRGWVGVVT